MFKEIEGYIKECLEGDDREIALDFVDYLIENQMVFYKDNCDCWKDKIYYWVKFKEECVCFIAIKDCDEPENRWTVWFDESKAYEADAAEEEIKAAAWKYIDYCGHCGSCGGGAAKTVFGKNFENVCGCTFRIDNPILNDLSFMKKMTELRKNEIIAKVS